MAKPSTPILFGRRMKPYIDPFSDDDRWQLLRGDVRFVLTNFAWRTKQPWRAEIFVGGYWIGVGERKTQRAAISWLTAQRNRLVKSLTPEKG